MKLVAGLGVDLDRRTPGRPAVGRPSHQDIAVVGPASGQRSRIVVVDRVEERPRRDGVHRRVRIGVRLDAAEQAEVTVRCCCLQIGNCDLASDERRPLVDRAAHENFVVAAEAVRPGPLDVEDIHLMVGTDHDLTAGPARTDQHTPVWDEACSAIDGTPKAQLENRAVVSAGAKIDVAKSGACEVIDGD